MRDAFTVDVTGGLDESDDRRRVSGGLADQRAVGGARHRPRTHGPRPGAGHARVDRRRVLGGLAARDGDAGRQPVGGEAYVELTGYGPATTGRRTAAGGAAVRDTRPGAP